MNQDIELRDYDEDDYELLTHDLEESDYYELDEDV